MSGSPGFRRRLVHDNTDYELHIGKGIMMRPGTDATIIACGIMVHQALSLRQISWPVKE